METDIFSVSMGIFGFFLQKCLLSSLRFIGLLSKLLNLICCQGDKKGGKMLKNLLLRNHKVDEADTLRTYL